VLLELFSGKSPTDDCFTGGLSIRSWVHSAFKEKTMEAIDPELVSLILHDDPSEGPNNVQLYCVNEIVGVAIACTADNPDERIGIRDAVRQLKASRDSLNHSDHTSTAHTNSYLIVSLK